MRHVYLTCKNHPHLRWSTKEIAFSDSSGYTGERKLFFWGILLRNSDGSPKLFTDRSGLECTKFDSKGLIQECPCSTADLIRAPEDGMIKEGGWE